MSINYLTTVLYYSLNKNHPFKNGNKRISTASLLVFLFINDYWLDVKKDDLLAKTLEIAKLSPGDREKIFLETKSWIESSVKKQ